MTKVEAAWRDKGTTLTDDTARKEFGLTQDEIVRAIRAGTLRCHRTSIYGNPCLRLFRAEVEALVGASHGADYLGRQRTKTELARIDRELKRLKRQIVTLEKRRAELTTGATAVQARERER